MTCGDVPALVWPSKDPDDTDWHYVDFEHALRNKWKPGTNFAATTCIRPTKPDGYQYESAGGVSGAREPRWGSATVSDGSITWTRQAISTTSLRTTLSGVPTWDADAGITVSDEGVDGQKAKAKIAGGTDQQDYTVLVQATLADGTTKTATVVLPIRRPVRVCEA